MINLKDMFVKKEELRKEQIVIAFDEELVYLTIASLQEEVVDVDKGDDSGSFAVTIRSSIPYLGEGMEKLQEIIPPEDFPDSIRVNDTNVDTSTYDEPVATLTIDVYSDLDNLDETYKSFVEFLKERATKYFATKNLELEKALATSLS